MSSLRPILGEKVESIYDIRLPCFASFKLDGWRGLWQGLEFFSRKGKTIPNRALQQIAKAHGVPPGWDGEIIVGEPNASDVFRRTDSFCKTANRALPTDGVRFFVFDNALDKSPFADRNRRLEDLGVFVVRLDQILIENYGDLEALEARAVGLGYEGLVTRTPLGRYKNGRSTLREQLLLKVKRYIDEEVAIIGLEEKLHNANPATLDELGYTHRTSHKENKVPAGTLGKIVVDWRGHPLAVGTGWTAEDGHYIWTHPDEFIGKRGTIKYSPVLKDLPRQAVWKGLRGDL